MLVLFSTTFFKVTMFAGIPTSPEIDYTKPSNLSRVAKKVNTKLIPSFTKNKKALSNTILANAFLKT